VTPYAIYFGIIMKLSLLVLLGFCLILLFPAGVQSQEDTLTILHLSDTHSHLVPFGPKDEVGKGTIGGIARAASVVRSIKQFTSNVLTLHAGDFFQGDMMFNAYLGVPELQILAGLGFDAMAVGNHEFDLSPSTLESSLVKAFADGGFPLLSANLVLDGYPSLNQYISPFIVKLVGGSRIGLFGMTSPTANLYSSPAPVFVDTNLVQIAAAAVDSLRARNTDLIIMLSHLGVSLERLIASSIPGIDIVISGHDHVAFEEPVAIQNPAGTTWHVAAGDFYRYLGELTVEIGTDGLSIIDYQLIPIDSSVPEEPMTAAFIDSLVAGIEARFGPFYSEPIAYAEMDIGEIPNPVEENKDTPLGNLITDAYRRVTNTQIALTVGGFISEKVYQGPVTQADIFRSVSYGYDPETTLGSKLVTFELTGLDLTKGLEFGVSSIEEDDELLVQASGMSYAYDRTKPSFGGRIDPRSILIGGQPVDPAVTYTVTSTDEIAGLLDLVGVTRMNLRILEMHEFTAVKNYVVQLDTVRYVSEGRIVDLSVATGREKERAVPESYEPH